MAVHDADDHVQLASGDLFLHSPIAFDAALAAHLQSLGRVRHLVSPNRGHYAHIGEWTRAFPDAVAWASPGVRERALSQGVDVQFQRDLEAQAPEENLINTAMETYLQDRPSSCMACHQAVSNARGDDFIGVLAAVR